MEIALIWPARDLRSRPLIMSVVGAVAALRARGLETEQIARQLRRGEAAVRRINRDGLDLIAVRTQVTETFPAAQQ
jgi:hypothetical protein